MLAWVLVFVGSGCEQEKAPPNIIFILADDLGYSQIGCYGTSYYETPNIDGLAKEGMRFTNAYAAASICSPTRASIMTGKYPARLHLTNYIPGTNKEFRLRQPDWQKFLPLEEVTFAEVLKERGYRTSIFGKWHLSIEKAPPQSLPYNPDKQGFDEHFVTYKPSGKVLQSWQDAENDAHNVDTITNLALDFIERNQSEPFMLFVSHNSIHDPLMERREAIRKYEQKGGADRPENNPILGAMIERLDKSCGAIFQKVKELGLDDNTIIIFFADNGGLETDAAQTPLRRGKGWLYEGGIKEPLIVKWKGKVTPGTTSSALVSSIDFLPTFLEVAGITDVPSGVDGRSFVPALRDPEAEVHSKLFWHFPHYHNGPPSGAIRMGDWKLIELYEESILNGRKQAFELYNLASDIGESTNLADSLEAKTAELALALEDWRNEVKAQLMIENSQFSEE